MTASTSSTLRPTTAGTLVAGFPRGRFSASPGTRVLSFSRPSSTTSPADALRGPGPLGAREGTGDVAAGRIERSARPLPVAGAGLDQAAQRLVCGAAPRAVLDGHLIARQADRAVDVADGTGPASSRTPYPTAEQAGPQVLRAPVAAALSSPPPDPLPGLAAALRGLTHEAAIFPQLIIIYDQIPDRRRGRGFATGIHLNEALEWSKRPGPPQFSRVAITTMAISGGSAFSGAPANRHCAQDLIGGIAPSRLDPLLDVISTCTSYSLVSLRTPFLPLSSCCSSRSSCSSCPCRLRSRCALRVPWPSARWRTRLAPFAPSGPARSRPSARPDSSRSPPAREQASPGVDPVPRTGYGFGRCRRCQRSVVPRQAGRRRLAGTARRPRTAHRSV